MKKGRAFIFLGLFIFVIGTFFLSNALAGSFNFSISAGTYSIAQKTVNGIPQIPVNIIWSSDATSCEAKDGWLGTSVGTSGVLPVYPTATTTYSLVCTKDGVYSYKSVKIYVTNVITTTAEDCSCYAIEANSMSSYICMVQNTDTGCSVSYMREPGIDATCGLGGTYTESFCSPPLPSDPPDTEAPILTISYPGNSYSGNNIGIYREEQYPSNGFQVTLAASDNVSVTELKYCDGGRFINCGSFSYGTILNGYATATINLNYPENYKLVCFNAKDAAGNTASEACLILTRVAVVPDTPVAEFSEPFDGKVYGSFYDNSVGYSGDGSDENFFVEREVNGNDVWTTVESYILNDPDVHYGGLEFTDLNPVCGSLKYRVGVISYGTTVGYSNPSTAIVHWNDTCVSENPFCGDGIVQLSGEIIEQCDGLNLSSQTCLTKGYSSGKLLCSSSTCQFDFTLCKDPITPLTCIDTDSPTVNYTSQGTVTASSGVNGTDYCFSSVEDGGVGSYYPLESGASIREYSCSDSVGIYQDYLCPAGCTSGACTGTIPPYCGDTIIQSPEVCDDGNRISTDVCSNTCTLTSCGDGIVQSPNGAGFSEQCDGTSGCNASCQFVPELYWADSANLETNWTSKSFTGASFDIAAVILSYSGPSSFNIYEKDTFSNDQFGDHQGTVLDINGDGADDLFYIFTINQSVIDDSKNILEGTNYEFYFDINGLTSPELLVSENLGLCGDGIQNGDETGVDCGGSCPVCPTQDDCVIAEVSLCNDYSTKHVGSYAFENACNLDVCSVAKQTPPPAGIGQTDKCQWDSSNVQCNKANLVTSSNGASIGSCTSKEDPRNDDCSDGFLSYSWSSNWAWATSNNFTSEASCELYSSPDCSGKCSGSGTIWHCDPYASQLSCQAGSSVIPCPAQVQLGFFDWRNVIAVVIIIFVLYILLMKKKKVPKNSSPKVKSKKK